MAVDVELLLVGHPVLILHAPGTTGFLTGNRNRSLYIRQVPLLNNLSKQFAAQGICPLEIPQIKNDGKGCCLFSVFMISFKRNIIVSVCLLYDPSKRIPVSSYEPSVCTQAENNRSQEEIP